MKAIYDKYGEYGLKEGVIGADGSKYYQSSNNLLRLETLGGGYFMKCNSNEVYEKEFTAIDPWDY